ncbi:MAG: M28 family peptidase [Bacillota bacterium]|nr:M28 family peptidase [Bacillota bacterium]
MSKQDYLKRIVTEYASLGDSRRYGGKHCGSDAERQGSEYIAKELRAIGLDSVEILPIETSRYQFNDAELKLLDEHTGETGQVIYPYGCPSPGTEAGGITAKIIDAGLGTRQDYETLDEAVVEGSLVLIEKREEFEGGYLLPAYQMLEAQSRGAAGVILYDCSSALNEETVIASVSAGELHIPVVAINTRDAQVIKAALRERAGSGKVLSAHLTVDVDYDRTGGMTYEVIGEIKGETEERILYTGHLDHFFRCMQDNISSVASLLAIAKDMKESGYKPRRTIDFVFNGSHEIGDMTKTPSDLFGAWSILHTLKPEWRDQIIADINFEYTALALEKFRGMASYETADILENFMKTMPDNAPGFKGVDREVHREDYYLFTWTDTAAFLSDGIPIFMNDSVSEQIYDGTSPYCGRDHSNHDDGSIFSYEALQTNNEWFGALGRYLDQLPVCPLDFTARARAMELCEEERAALDRWEISYSKYETALTAFAKAAESMNEWLSAYNADPISAERSLEIGRRLRKLNQQVSKASDLLTTDLIGMFDVGHKIYIRKVQALEEDPSQVDIAAVSANFGEAVCDTVHEILTEYPQTWSEGKIRSVLTAEDVAPEQLAQTIAKEKQLLQTILQEETDMLLKAVQEMGMITFADETQYLEWIKGFTKLPHRKTGTPEGRRSAEYVRDTFRSMGMEDVRIETAGSVCMDVRKSSLTVNGEPIDAFFANGTGRGGRTGKFTVGDDNLPQEMIYLGDGEQGDFDGADVKGKIVLCDIWFLTSHPTDLWSWNEDAEVIDPDGKIDRPLNKYDIYTPNNWPYNYYRALNGGAAGFVGILHNFMDQNYYHEDYTEITEMFGNAYMSMPALWISREDGKHILEHLHKGQSVSCCFCTDVVYEERKALNVSGKLPGMRDDIILVHSHHDAVCEGAVQDASGMSEVFALARYFAGLPKPAREYTMMFAATDSHYTDYEGHVAFVEERKRQGDHIILDCCIEHVAREMDLDEDYNIVMRDEPETRMIYVSDRGGLIPQTRELLQKYGLDKTFIFPVHGQSAGAYTHEDVCSDAYVFDAEGIPVVSILAAPMYLFHNTDTLDKVYVPGLRPIGMAYAELITNIKPLD